MFNLELKKIRIRAGLSQKELADMIGVKVSTYGTWERGERMMSLEQAYRVTELLGCTIDELVGRPKPSTEYSDPAQQALNEYYESSSDKARGTIVDVARSVSVADTE